MKNTHIVVLALATLACILASSTASADFFVSPYGDVDVDVRIGWRGDQRQHAITWRRVSDGTCAVTLLTAGSHVVLTGTGNDHLKVPKTDDFVVCSGQSIRVGPFRANGYAFELRSGSGNDILVVSSPVTKVAAGAGNDLIVDLGIVAWLSELAGELGNDTIETWSDLNRSVLLGGDGDDCMWVKDDDLGDGFLKAGRGQDRCNVTPQPAIDNCEEIVPCCSFGALMGVCQP